MSDGKTKELRTTMTASENIFMALMPISQTAAWLSLMKFKLPLSTVLPIFSLFYALWALKKVVVDGDRIERGHFTMGLTFVGSAFIGLESRAGRVVTMAGLFTVLASFVIAGMKVLQWPASKLAHVVKKTLLWAYIIKAYFISSLAFWLTVFLALWGEHARKR